MPEHPDRSFHSVSVVLPTYNSAPFVSRAIDSVLGQEGDHTLELIIVDDCSPDGTAQFVQQHYGSDQRVHLIVSKRNVGPGAARNRAIAQAKGSWIALIDADDAWTTDRLSRALPLCTDEVDVLFDNLIGYDQTAQMRTGLLFPSMPQEMTVAAMAAAQVPRSKFNFGYLKPLIRRDFLRRTQVQYPEIRISEDLLFYLEILINRARTRTMEEGCYIYTTNVGQISGRCSTTSATIPDDELVSNLLDGLAAKYRDQLNAEGFQAISNRAGRYRRLAPVNRLYHHWVNGQYLAAARQCLADRSVRQHLVRAVSRRLFPG